MEILPAIIAHDAREVIQKIKLIQGHVHWAQLDIMDGMFVAATTWNNSEDLERVDLRGLRLEAHLMVRHPLQHVQRWMHSKVSRILLHAEAEGNLNEFGEMIHGAQKEFGIVLNPETSVDFLEHVSELPDVVQMMSVHPGRYGAEFLPEVLEKGKTFKIKYPQIPLAIDGGVNEKTLPLIMAAGFDRYSVGSAIFESKDPVQAILSLQKLIPHQAEKGKVN